MNKGIINRGINKKYERVITLKRDDKVKQKDIQDKQEADSILQLVA